MSGVGAPEFASAIGLARLFLQLGRNAELAARHFALFSFAGVLDPGPPFVAEPTLPLRFAVATGTGASTTKPDQQILLESLLCLSELHELFRLLELVVLSLTGPSPIEDGHGNLDRLGPESRDWMVELSSVHDRGVDSWLLARFNGLRLMSGLERFASGEMGGEGSDLFRLGGRLVCILELVQELFGLDEVPPDFIDAGQMSTVLEALSDVVLQCGNVLEWEV